MKASLYSCRFCFCSCLAVLALLQATPTAAATTLPQYLDGLLREHDRIRVMRHRHDAARYGTRQSQAGNLPALNLSSDGGRERIDREDAGVSDEWRYRATLRATQLVTDFGRTSREVQRAASNEDRSKAELEMVRQDVLLEGMTAWLNLVRARLRLGYARDSAKSIGEQVRMEERLRQTGAGLSSDVLQARAQYAGALAVTTQFEGDLAVARNRFQNVFHVYPDLEEVKTMEAPQHLEHFLPAGLDEGREVAAKNSALLELARRELKLADDELAAQRTMLWPRLEMFGELERRQDDDGTPGYRNDAAVGLQLTVNFFRGGADRAAVDAASSRLDAAGANLEFVRRQVEEELRNAWDLYLTAGGNAQHQKEQAANLEEFLSLARRERKLGTRSLLDLLNAEVAVLAARSSAAAAEIDRLVQACRLLHVLGHLSVDTAREAAAAR